MSRKSRKTRARRNRQSGIKSKINLKSLPQQETKTNIPRKGGQLIATAHNDISIPFYSDVLQPQDPTIHDKGTHKGLKLYDEVTRDGRARTTLNKRYSKATRREWILEAGGDDPLDLKAKEGIEAILGNLPFDQVCKDLLKAILKGFAISEVVWGRDEDGLVVPIKIKSHDQIRFTFDKDWKPRLKTLENSIEGEELPDRKFITHRFDAEGNNPYGLGLGSVLFWHVLFKREGVGFWLRFLDKFATPIPFGKYPVGTPDGEQAKLLNSLLAMVQQGALIAPIGTDVEFLEATRSGTVSYEEWCRYWDEQTAEVVLGSTLATGVKGQGSRAASDTHAEETESIIDDDCDQLSATLNDTLITWISELNWPNANPPKVWRPRPRNETKEEEHKKKKHERQQAGIRTLHAARQQGYEPKDVKDWLGDVMDTEMVPIEQQVLKSPTGQDEPQSFSDSDGPVDFLIEQLEELSAPMQEAWLAQIKEKLEGVEDFAQASQALLELSHDLEVDPMGNVLGDGFALAHMTGRSDIFDETGIYPEGSKKNT